MQVNIIADKHNGKHGYEGAAMGLPASLTASILGLGSLAIVCTIVTRIRRLFGETGRIPFPAGPFLAAGTAAAYFMKLGGLIL